LPLVLDDASVYQPPPAGRPTRLTGILGPGYHVAERSLAIAIMRILWAFDIKWAKATKLPVDPLTYTRHSEMPGNPSSRMPVTLQVLSQEKANIIKDTFEALQQSRLPIVCPSPRSSRLS
jgi:hypothetical protein